MVGFLPEFLVRPSSQTLRCELVVVFRGVVVAVEKVFTVQLYQRDQRCQQDSYQCHGFKLFQQVDVTFHVVPDFVEISFHSLGILSVDDVE